MTAPADAQPPIKIMALFLGETGAALHLAEIDGPGVGWVPRSMVDVSADALEQARKERRRGNRAALVLALPRWKLADLGWGGAGEGQGRLFA